MMNYSEEKTIIDLSTSVNIYDLGIKITSVLESGDTQNKELFLKLGSIDMKQSQLLSIKALIEAMQAKLVGIETTSEMTETSAIGLGLVVSKPQQPIAPQPATFNTEAQPQQTVQQEQKTEELSSFSQLRKVNSIGDFVSDTETLSEVQDDNLKEETEQFLKEAEEEETTSEEEFFGNTSENTTETETNQDEIQNALDITFGANMNIAENIASEKVVTDDITDNNISKEVVIPAPLQKEFEEATETKERSEESKYVLLDTEGITPEGIELIKSNTSDLSTLYLTQTLRSGQTVSYEGNIFLIGDAHPGSEINATGDITVWGILGGIAHAGSEGNHQARIRALKMNAIQLRIAHVFARRPDGVNTPFVQKSNEFVPEEARVYKETIIINKLLEN
jgi:septum site-determining protein MinC